MNDFSPGRPGGGNVGFALDCRTSVRVRTSDADRVTSTAREVEIATLVRHALGLWRGEVDGEARFAIDVETVMPAHVGLASSAAVQVAVLAALNWMHGHPLPDERLRALLAAEYREAAGTELVPGFTTALSSLLNLYGGFAAVDSSLSCIFHRRVPAWSYAVCVHPRLAAVSHGEAELQTLMHDGRAFDTREADAKRDVLTGSLFPAIAAADLRAAGDAIAELQRLGSKRAEIALHGEGLRTLLADVRADGVEVTFLSAVGPGMVLLSEAAPESLAARAAAFGLTVLKNGVTDNRGLIVTTEEPDAGS